MEMRNTRTIIYLVVIAVCFGLSIFMAFRDPLQAAGWVQVALVILGIPLIFLQLHEIRGRILQKPSIQIGLASVSDLPLSKIKNITIDERKKIIEVKQGYPFFMLVVYNSGSVIAKAVKIHLEFENHSEVNSVLHSPVMKVSEFSDNKKGFVPENNVDFTFLGGADFYIYPGDFASFSFYFSTSILENFKGKAVPCYPDACNCDLNCCFWAEGLEKPIEQKLKVKIVERELPLDQEIESLFPPHSVRYQRH